jgi:hypothetical protein
MVGGAMRTRTKDPDGFIDGARRDRWERAFDTKSRLRRLFAPSEGWSNKNTEVSQFEFGLAAARLRYIAGTAWSAKCYMNMRPLYQPQILQTEAVA